MIRIAQIGCGYWGPNLVRNFSVQPGCEVKWVAEESAARRQYVELNFPKTQVTPDWRRAVSDPEIDAVVVATPAATHHALALAALECGKHVLVEKPLAMRSHDADDLIRAAAARSLILMVGHTFLYNAAVQYMKKLVDAGDLGQIYYVYSQRLNLGQVRTDVNAWWNLAPHDISILTYLFEKHRPHHVLAHGVASIQPGIEDAVFANLVWENGMTAHVQVSWLDPGKIRRMTLVGSRKMVIYDDVSEDKIWIVDKGIDRVPRVGEAMDYDYFSGYQLLHRAGDILLPRINFEEPLKTEAAHFLDCVRTGRTPLTGPEHARCVVAVLEAGERSLKRCGAAEIIFNSEDATA
ncbi:MAG: oxidoreductase [Blastocatellia bacterium]|nr:MAG: oxidoreductase [Blastocatellia bacterium]